MRDEDHCDNGTHFRSLHEQGSELLNHQNQVLTSPLRSALVFFLERYRLWWRCSFISAIHFVAFTQNLFVFSSTVVSIFVIQPPPQCGLRHRYQCRGRWPSACAGKTKYDFQSRIKCRIWPERKVMKKISSMLYLS